MPYRSNSFRAAIAEDRFVLVLIGCTCGIFFTTLAFWLTVPPLVDYIAILFMPWIVIVRDIVVHHMVPRLSAQEWAAVFLKDRGPFKGTRGPFKGTRGPLKGTRGPFKGARGPLKGTRGPL